MGRLAYTTQEVQDRLDSVGQMVRPNLLDNAYFIGGGSQSGSGKFPINQRGATSYTTGYSIDRWSDSGGISVALMSDCVKLTTTASTTARSIRQSPENKEELYGKTVTLSVLYGSVTDNAAYCGIFKGASPNYATSQIAKSGNATSGALMTVTARLDGDFSTYPYITAFIGFGNESGGVAVGATAEVKAAKLELGDSQTLAHWDETTQAWVLNEVPNFGEELARCERYYYAMPNYVRFPTTRWLSGEIDFLIPVPVTMRTTPTIVGTPVVYSGNTAQSGFTFTMTGMGNNALAVRASKASHGLTDEGVSLYVAGTALSADL